ncbi:tRNA-guanine(15) transglycosylase-like protein [Crucibulum laeve]|uniref:tRNA-guanine(15) transglycosylase-like protein n=1 Tax=Crucibulum laeve TaxID=68775 RepID=A0A5C3LTK7_9AGAR|nr:tRNA-guanine(15) transglycosylase-like protein [Crucibulum laeve]
MSSLPVTSGLHFSLLTPPSARFGPRLGTVVFKRPGCTTDQPFVTIPTPGLLTATSRGVVPHLSRDHHRKTQAIKWVHIPFETFLEHNPPVPTLQTGKTPLHTFLGFNPGQHLLSMSARDLYDGREMPPNGKDHVSVYSLRGVRKLSPAQWRSYVYSVKPDIVMALSDTPFTDPPYSQKRLTKSIERSFAWLLNVLCSLSEPEKSTLLKEEPHYKPTVLVHMSGMTSIPARRAFADSLLEPLFGPEAEQVKHIKYLDEGVSGYSFDLVPLRLSLDAAEKKSIDAMSPPSSLPSPAETPDPTTTALDVEASLSQLNLDSTIPPHIEQILPLLKTSLERLPTTKPRIVNSTQTPHETLRLISSVGIDLFDAHWAQRASDIGVSLDFVFPAPQGEGRKDLGHNLYHDKYTYDFSPLASSFRGAIDTEFTKPICQCLACSPSVPPTRLYHGVDEESYSGEPVMPLSSTPRYKPSFTRAYLHHLLHTHEMSAHSLLVMHNISILDAFFSSIRKLLSEKPESWDAEVKRFIEAYDEDMVVLDEARVSWKEVELARGKGRLAREKAKQDEGTLGTAVELE